jgi:branched-chain amino acid transport system ATP-binding protein
LSVLLSVQGLEGGYGRLTVFREVSLRVDRGQTIGLLGANGAGKTTLMKTIAGSLRASAGTITLDGKEVSRLPAYERARGGLALVPEGRHILASLSVQDNLALTRAIEGHRPDLAPYEARLAEVFGLFPRLKERAGQLGGSLSGGEQQMLAIARALLLKPDVLMLDEPTQGLAPIVIRSLAETLRGLRGRFAMIIVEQNKAFLEGLTDRVLFMRAGTLNAGATA